MLYRGTFVHCASLGSLEIFHDHLLAASDTTGIITHFASQLDPTSIALYNSTPKASIVQLSSGSFFLPTFADLHLHAAQFLYQGNGLDLPLMQWLEKYAYAAEEKIDNDSNLAEKVYTRLAQRLVQNGTGCVVLFGTISVEKNLILANAMHNQGIRAFVGKLSMDISFRPTYIEPSAQHSLKAAQEFVDKCKTQFPSPSLITPVLTPRFVPTCSDALLHGLGKMAREQNLFVQSHLAESHDQVKMVRDQKCKEDLEVFHEHGLMTSRTIQAHCTYIPFNSSDYSPLADLNGATVVHCPLSNAYFSARPLALREALDSSLSTGLGTDVAGGYSADIMNAMRSAVLVSRMREGDRIERNSEHGPTRRLVVNWIESLYLSTRGGLRALDVNSGVFEVGREFDAQMIQIFDFKDHTGTGALDFFDLEFEGIDTSSDCLERMLTDITETTLFELTPEMIEKWWCLGDVRNRVGMFVRGRKVY